MPSRVKTHLVIIDLPRQLCRGTGAPAVAGHIDQVPNMVTGEGTNSLELKATPQDHFKPQNPIVQSHQKSINTTNMVSGITWVAIQLSHFEMAPGPQPSASEK